MRRPAILAVPPAADPRRRPVAARSGFLLGLLLLLLATAVASVAPWGPSHAEAALPPGGTFIDDDGNLHEGAIEAIAAAGITNGCDPVGDRYCPDQEVSRAEMAVFLLRALGETAPPYQGYFSDVPAGTFYTGAVERMFELGVTTGVAPGTYGPALTVTRAQMAAFLVRALGETPSSGPSPFADVPAGVWYEGHATRIHELGITVGCATSPLRYCPDAPVTRAEMASFLARAFGLPLDPPPPRPSLEGVALGVETVVSGLSSPMHVAALPGDDRLFIVERAGRIRIWRPGGLEPTPFLDITAQVGTAGEGGLFAVAFHPSYPENGRFFVSYTDTAGDSRVVEYLVSSDPDVADPASARPLLFVDQPASNHNGGMIAFGPDGGLYVGLGDGGGAGDPFGHGQRPDTLLATITRIDPDSGATSLFAYGLRNPWRFSVDGQRFYIGDVGQNAREEIDVLSIFQAGANLGWPITEGTLCFGSSSCDTAGLVLPVLDYDHGQGCSVTGGVVYRGSAIAALDGHYLYGDFCSGTVWSFRYTGVAEDRRTWGFMIPSLVSFGTDGNGEVLLVSLGGTVYRLVGG